ncbi:MAG: hypothetical protein IKB26_03645, partial [Bacteroidales bacterium]|nr:hypothetical protein [Bacteroidales bacterium]
MKKSFFGFSAKVAMAVLAVCSFVLTSRYEKSPIAKTPSEYHVVGSVYDAETGKVISDAKVTLDGQSVSSTFNIKLSGYVSSVTVAATAEGYLPGSRTVAIQKLGDYNQVSVTSVDLALVKVPVTPEDPDDPTPDDPTPDDPQPEEPVLEAGDIVVGNAGLTAEAVKALFGITFGDVAVNEEGLVEVFAHYSLGSDAHGNLHSNFHANFNPTHVNHLNHTNATTNSPLFVEDSSYVGFVANVNEGLADYLETVKVTCMAKLNTVWTGTQYKDFASNYVPFATV